MLKTSIRLLAAVMLLLASAVRGGATYSPEHGRFIQRDPNGLAVATAAGLSYHGRAPRVHLQPVSPIAHFGDGMSTHQFVQSAPLHRTDPTGMWMGMAFQLGTMAIQATVDANGTMVEARDGLLGLFGLRDMLGTYGSFQDSDAYWAGNWDLRDDAMMAGQWTPDPWSYVHSERWSWMGGRKIRAPRGPRGVVIRNGHLAGQFHPIVWNGQKVFFKQNGYPDFTPFAIKTQGVSMTTNRDHNMTEADRLCGYNATNPRPQGYTWHEHEDMKTMQLVPTPLHRLVGHTGAIGNLRRGNRPRRPKRHQWAVLCLDLWRRPSRGSRSGSPRSIGVFLSSFVAGPWGPECYLM